MSCCKGSEPSDPPVEEDASLAPNEIELWMDMMKHMLECAELTMTAIKSAKENLKFSEEDLIRFSALCNAVEKLREQLKSVGENFLRSPNSHNTTKPKSSIKESKIIRRKECCIQADDDMLRHNKKKLKFRKNTCFCGKFKKSIVERSRKRRIVVCSPAINSTFVNQKCSRSYALPDGGELGNIPQDHPYIIKDDDECTLPENGIGYEFFCAMHRYSDRIAQYIDETGEKQTFTELLRDCISLALKLKEKNFGKDDVICICTSNHKYTCVPYISAAFAGCQINALDVSLNLSEIDYLLELVKPKMMFVQKEVLPLVEASLQKTDTDVQIVIIGGVVDEYVPFLEYLQASDEDISNFRPEKVKSMNETFAILYTSGTTDDPKAVRLSHHSMLKQFVVALSSGNFQRVFLAYTSYYSVISSIFLGASILGGFARVVASTFSPEGMYRVIDKYKVESVFLSPHDCVTFAKYPKPEDVDTSSLQVLATGGACLKATYLQQLRSLFPGTCVFQMYGLTETGGLTFLWSKNQSQNVTLFNARPASSGMPCGGTCCKIIDRKTGEILGPNQTGELCVKSDTIMQGYHGRNSLDVMDNSGWLKTGDLAYYDEYHCFYIIDKLTELINIGEKSIEPCRLENILMEHPSVERAVVLGLSTPNNSVVAVGFIILKSVPGLEVDLKEILEFVNKQENEERFLKDIRTVDRLPLTPTGKVKRKLFRESRIEVEETETVAHEMGETKEGTDQAEETAKVANQVEDKEQGADQVIAEETEADSTQEAETKTDQVEETEG